jgi:hypothetical protein
MKKLLVVLLILLVAVCIAQIPNGTSVGFGATPSSPCQNPTAGMNFICSTATGIQLSLNGAAYVPLQGAMPSTLNCDFVLAAGGKATLSNCK